MGKLFGTDGVRGVANTQLTSKLAYLLGYNTCMRLTNLGSKPTFVVGEDTRCSKDMLFCALSSGILSCGGKVINAGVMPTPAIAVLTRHFNADAGVVISASHNPYEYNGIKFFDSEGFKLPDHIEEEIEEGMLYNKKLERRPVGNQVGVMETILDADKIYKDYLLEKIGDFSLEGLKIVLDLANGATYKIAPMIFKSLGAEVICVADKPNGVNINDDCGSTCVKNIIHYVLKHKADVGFAFDGDGDRLIAVDSKGNEVNGDKIMYALSCFLKDIGKLKNNTLVATVMSNLGLKKALEKQNIEISKTSVGDRYVVERMIEKGYVLGGEQSGHIICTYLNSTGDGIATALLLSKMMVTSGKSLEEIVSGIKMYPQVLINAVVSNDKKNTYKQNEEIMQEIEVLTKKYDDNGRVLIRTSGTEPLIRVMIEGEDSSMIKKDARALADFIEKKLK